MSDFSPLTSESTASLGLEAGSKRRFPSYNRGLEVVVRTTTHTKNLLLSAAFHSQLGTPERPRLAGAISDNEKRIHDKQRSSCCFPTSTTTNRERRRTRPSIFPERTT